MLVINANIHTMAGKIFKNGFIRIEGKIIKEIGNISNLSLQNKNDVILDIKGANVYPGFIDAHTHLGMWEDGLCFEGDDGNEETDPVTPQLRAIDAVNPMDRCFSEALKAGVTTIVTGPGSANPIGGQLAALKTKGTWVDEKRRLLLKWLLVKIQSQYIMTRTSRLQRVWLQHR